MYIGPVNKKKNRLNIQNKIKKDIPTIIAIILKCIICVKICFMLEYNCIDSLN